MYQAWGVLRTIGLGYNRKTWASVEFWIKDKIQDNLATKVCVI